ncbi:MAG: hypothetical protein FDX30_05510 [Chlorobium sp.]|nr:MAG: hypothetical protein FDX30_05510 [Chlorobium sp.]
MRKRHETNKRKSSIKKQEKTMHHIVGRFPLSDRMLNIPLTQKRKERMKAYSVTLYAVPSNVTNYSLEQWQSPVKDQDGRGSCATFSFLGAIEARYRREYNLAVDLSAEYFINVVFSTQPTCDPSLLHENICTDFLYHPENPNPPLDSGMTDGAILMMEEKLLLPEMRFCPYFGVEHANDPPVFGITHSDADLDQIAADAGLISLNPPGSPTPWNVLAPYTQQAVDNYYYDFRHIPLVARKNACYGAEEIEFVTSNDPAILESCIYGNNEVVVGMGLGKLDWGEGAVPGTYTNGQPVQMIGTVPVAIYPDQNLKDKKDTNGNVIGKYGTNEDYHWNDNKKAWELLESGHSMIAVAFDTTLQLILFKNSWGTGSLPYLWIPYQFIQEKCGSAFIITKVRDPLYNNWGEYPVVHASEKPEPSDQWDHLYEAMWLGRWKMDINGSLGDLVIRHTRARGQDTGTVCRLGSYYDGQGIAHMVTGYIKAAKDIYFTPSAFSGPTYEDPCKSYAHLWIDFDNPEGPPYPAGSDIACKGQEFKIQMFPHPIGGIQEFEAELAVGETTSNGVKYGVILYRTGKEIGYTPGEFNIEKWNGQYLILPCHTFMTIPQLIQVKVNETPQGGEYFANLSGEHGFSGTGTIDENIPNRMDISLRVQGYAPLVLSCSIYLHMGEVGLASGLGAGIFTKSFYVGNEKSKELHMQSCYWAQSMSAKHKRYFFNVNQALEAGYNGCYYCMRQYDTD